MTHSPGLSPQIRLGDHIFTSDGEEIGTVKEVRDGFFKVDAAMRPDYWLRNVRVASSGGGRITLSLPKEHLSTYQVTDPEPASARSEPPDAIDLLTQMHSEAKDKFQQILIIDSPSERQQMWQQFQPVLKVHEQMEDTYLYGPLSRERPAGSELAHWEPQHDHEVDAIERLIGQLNRIDPADQMWPTTLEQIRSRLSEHIAEEEGTIFPRIRTVWGEGQLRDAGQKMSEMLHARIPSATV